MKLEILILDISNANAPQSKTGFLEYRVMKSKIGILGDGQLALMLSESLVKLGYEFLCFSTADDSPMHTYFPKSITNDIEKFLNECEVFTLENEFHTIDELKQLLKNKSDNLFPDLHSYSHFANKISQRLFYERAGISSPKWMPLYNEQDLATLKTEFPFPFILKMSQGGYDGKGVRVIHDESMLNQALLDFKFSEGMPLLVEEKIQIKTEVAQGFLKHANGKFTLLPLVETVQEDGICNLVQYPATVNPNIQSQIEFFLEKLINAGLNGIFNFEFFVDKNNRVLINEGAPRTHNSQHLTMDASPFSQFDLLAMYLTDPTLAPEKIKAEASVMINILGKKSGAYGELKLPEVPVTKIVPKLYGKKKSSPGRKMGHVNIVDESGRSDLLSMGRKILQEYEL